MNMSNIKIGDKIVCISNKRRKLPIESARVFDPIYDKLIVGQVYTVRGVIGITILLDEIRNPTYLYKYKTGCFLDRYVDGRFHEIAYRKSRFKKLVEWSEVEINRQLSYDNLQDMADAEELKK